MAVVTHALQVGLIVQSTQVQGYLVVHLNSSGPTCTEWMNSQEALVALYCCTSTQSGRHHRCCSSYWDKRYPWLQARELHHTGRSSPCGMPGAIWI